MLIDGLVSTSVVKVLIAPKENRTKSVYEAVITEMENQTLRGYDYVFLTLSAEYVAIMSFHFPSLKYACLSMD